jgi:site-specific DNA recombinase
MRAVIYARYSSEHQREASIEDQVEVCRRYAVAQNWSVVGRYHDAAISGASAILRPGFQKLLHDAERRQFDIVICEAVDRLGRKLADVATLYDRLTFLRIQIHAASLGLVTQMHIGIMGTMAQMMLTDLRDKVRRGQLGRARAGRIPGGLAYGYEVVPQAHDAKEGGERRIVPEEAAIVLRIFRDYAAGISPRVIAHTLNKENVPGPDGRKWGDSTIRGQIGRGTGLLNNTVYDGVLSWNRCSYVKNPSTGKRIARINPREQWEVVEVHELRIVHTELWHAVKARQAAVTFDMGKDETGQHLNAAHRRKFLLSGLLVCGCCGGGYTIITTDRYGCATHRGKGTCSNSRTIRRQHLEARVLSGLKERMLAPELVAEFVQAFTDELASLRAESAREEGRLRSELGDISRRLDAVLTAIENGAWSAGLQTRLSEIEARQTALQAQLQACQRPESPVVLHPNAAELYKRKVGELEAALAEPDICSEAGEALANLIDKIVLTPDKGQLDGVAIDLHGTLAAILSMAGVTSGTSTDAPAIGARRAAKAGGVESLLSVVAGVGFEPTTFRL